MNDVSIRRATPADARILSALAVATFPLACPAGTTTEDIARFCATRLSVDAFDAYLASAEHALWLSFASDEAVGYVMLVSREPSDPDVAGVLQHRPTVEISKIYVLASHHGRSIASRLMDTVIEAARLEGAASMWLGVNQDNERANRFYEKTGFELVGTRSFLVGTSIEADFVREKPLTTDPYSAVS